MPDPTQQDMNKFVRTVDEFMRNNKKLLSKSTQNSVYNSGDPELIADYENAIVQSGRLKDAIVTTVGAWKAAKRTYSNITDTTSMVIGDAIDEIRSWFGYDPSGGISGLGIIQLPAIAWVAGIIGAAVLANTMMSKIFVRIEASRLEKTGMSRAQAINVASNAMMPSLFKAMNVPLVIGGALAVWLLMR